jgi:hypothetical protein
VVIVHKDNSCYELPYSVRFKNHLAPALWGLYSPKFEEILKSNNISYKISDYGDYENDLEGDYFVGRFAQSWGDRTTHSKYFDKLYDYYGENMWPNKKAYYYYDDKIKQLELLKKYNRHIPSIVCNDLDELLKNVTVGTVIKSTYGAGADAVIGIWKKEHLDNIEEYISNCYNSENFFPCIVQEYINFDWEYIVCSTSNEVYGYKRQLPKDWHSPNRFPYNNGTGDWAEFEYNDKHGNRFKTHNTFLRNEELDSDLIEFIRDVKNELNTPNLKFDMINGKVVEFSYLYGEIMPYIEHHLETRYNLLTNTIEDTHKTIPYYKYEQINSVLKHLGIIK